MVVITGDTHGDFSRLSNKNLGRVLDYDDYCIICGDFGLLWQKNSNYEYWKDFLEGRKFTTLWVDGNHENFDWVYSLPVSEWHGGKVHMISDNIIHLMRGQVYTIENKKYFTFGGARSHDIQGGVLNRDDPDFDKLKMKALRRGLPYRVNHESWWEQEIPSDEEMDEGLLNLKKHNNKVDIIITHCCSSRTLKDVSATLLENMQSDKLTDYLDIIEDTVDFKKWYFGHYHQNFKIYDKYELLYDGAVAVFDKICSKDKSTLMN